MKPKISVIIPAYNAERTIERAVKGVLSQTLHELEVVVVDDGSIDRTGSILDAMAQQNERLRVLHQSNAGAFAARLNGLKYATGEYFGFLDADDHVEPQMYRRMIGFAREHDLDIVQCDLWGAVTVGKPAELFLNRQAVLDKVVRPRLVEGCDSMLVWDKIYRNQYDLSDWKVENYWTGEDYVLNWRFFKPVSRVGYLHEGYYHYAITPSSSTRRFTDKTIPGFKATVRMRNKLAQEYGFNPESKEFALWVIDGMRNIFVVATSAPAKTFAARMARAREVLWCDELTQAFQVLHSGDFKFNSNARFLKVCRSLPIGLTILAIGLPKRMQLFFRDLRLKQD